MQGGYVMVLVLVCQFKDGAVEWQTTTTKGSCDATWEPRIEMSGETVGCLSVVRVWLNHLYPGAKTHTICIFDVGGSYICTNVTNPRNSSTFYDVRPNQTYWPLVKPVGAFINCTFYTSSSGADVPESTNCSNDTRRPAVPLPTGTFQPDPVPSAPTLVPGSGSGGVPTDAPTTSTPIKDSHNDGLGTEDTSAVGITSSPIQSSHNDGLGKEVPSALRITSSPIPGPGTDSFRGVLAAVIVALSLLVIAVATTAVFCFWRKKHADLHICTCFQKLLRYISVPSDELNNQGTPGSTTPREVLLVQSTDELHVQATDLLMQLLKSLGLSVSSRCITAQQPVTPLHIVVLTPLELSKYIFGPRCAIHGFRDSSESSQDVCVPLLSSGETCSLFYHVINIAAEHTTFDHKGLCQELNISNFEQIFKYDILGEHKMTSDWKDSACTEIESLAKRLLGKELTSTQLLVVQNFCTEHHEGSFMAILQRVRDMYCNKIESYMLSFNEN